MFKTNIFRLVIMAGVLMTSATAVNKSHAVGCLDQTGCVDCCPTCGYRCHFDAECEDKKIDGFDVDSKVICIPRVVFPWQRRDACGCMRATCSKCNHNGARLRRVCVLKKDSKTCPKCKYSWEAKKRSCGCSSDNAASTSTTVASPSMAVNDSNQSPAEGSLQDAPYTDFSSPVTPGFEAATTYPTPLDNDAQPDNGVLNSPSVGTPGMEEALQYPTPIRPSQGQ